MKLKCDEPLSNFAFNVNLRRYNEEYALDPQRGRPATGGACTFFTPHAVAPNSHSTKNKADAPHAQRQRPERPVNLMFLVGRCRLPVSKPELKARLVSALETNM